MNFEVFSKTELEDMYNAMAANMSDQQKAVFIEHYGSMDEWKKSFLENASSEAVQKNFQKVVEWYGSKEKALEASKNPGNSELVPAYQKRLGIIVQKLAEKKGYDVTSFEVKELIGEYDFVSKQLYQMEDVSALMRELAEAYQNNKEIQKVQDSVYGEGVTEFIGRAIAAFYTDR